jgi:radical SAM protein with 4Fe4S-binding SPASM domain
MKRLASGEKIRNNIDLRVMVTEDSTSNVSVIESSEEALAIFTEWRDFTAEVERELGLSPYKRQQPNAKTILQSGIHEHKEYRLQRGITLTFWDVFTFANTRVSDDYELQTREETVFCPHPFKDFGVLWNGDVTLCCLDYDGQLKVGNVQDDSIETIMQGEAAKNIRASMLGRSALPPVCQTCQARPVKRE